MVTQFFALWILNTILFVRGCVSGNGFAIIVCHLLRKFRGNTRTFYPLQMCSVWCLQTIGYIMACKLCSFACKLHHLIIIIMETYLKALKQLKCLLPSLCLRLRQFSQLSSIQYMGFCAFGLFKYPVMIVRTNVFFILLSSSNRKNESLLAIV